MLSVFLELLQKRSVKIKFRVPEPMEVKECFFLSQFWDASEQSGNWNCIGKIHLHEYTGFLLEVFLHPISGFDYRAAEVMFPLPAVQVPETTRSICIHHEWV